MKLFSINLSHYAARVRIALLVKGLSPEVISAPVGSMAESLRAPEYVALNPNPMGRVPCLVTDDGIGIGESTVILEYLEDAFPTPALMPASAVERARVRLAIRVGELYVSVPHQALIWHTNPANRDEALVKEQLAKMETGLTWLEQHMDDGPYAIGDGFTLADCVLPTMVRIVPDFARVFDTPSLVDNHPKLMAYLERVSVHPAVAEVLEQMKTASVTYRTTGKMT